ncbi:Glycoside hydrolase family 63 protein [Paramicrosporidium saccamoebae]|uniref:mannosyl-oligosaccharide glucosidase n=1 Tax=Paramicrosporidium saccamoebae TaxID=1246581 RepID=A0A2H9TNJ8_9FUNG|nr:Glycoside hydrolase family 63 protein [Paramicrosporidium saccamoebae]
MQVSWMHYAAYNGAEYAMNTKSNNNHETLLRGWTSDTGEFTLRISYPDARTMRQSSMIVEPSNQWRMKEIISAELGQCAATRVEHEKDLSPANLFLLCNPSTVTAPNALLTQLVFDSPFKVEIEYDGRLENFRTLGNRSPLLNDFESRFDEFLSVPQIDLDTKNMSKVALSNLLGGIGYSYGRGVVYEWVDGIRRLKETEPFELLTDTPSRATSPCGFLWDSGFDSLVIQKWNPHISLRIIANWAERIDQNGWMAREQIAGEEARGQVPIDHWPQNPKFGNPPSLLLPLYELVLAFNKDPETSDSITLLLPHFERNLRWFTRTQHGNLHPALEAQSSAGLYRWRGRSKHYTLTSGLEDYPRGTTPNEYELHVDLAAWMAFAARTLRRLREITGTAGDVSWTRLAGAPLAQIEEDAMRAIENVHWNERAGCYQDRTIDQEGRPRGICHAL